MGMHTSSKLAIFGGEPIRKTKIYYGKQSINENDIHSVVRTLKSDFITQGPQVHKFEMELSDYTTAAHCLAVSSGTAALHLACLAVGIQPGDEVITTPLTFAASANCVLYCGGKPVFADINSKTYNIDPVSIESKITSKTKAIIAVDYAGQVVDVDRVRELCNKHDLYFIEDAAHSIGSTYKDKNVGSLADITTFSFHPVKTITGGEGGAVLTNNRTLFAKMKSLRTHGISKDFDSVNNIDKEMWFQEQVALGYNYRMTDFQAALLRSQLERIATFKRRRKQIVRQYNDAFAEMKEIITQEENPVVDACKHLYVIQLNRDYLRCTRKEFFNSMVAENVVPQVHYIPVYYFPYYRELGYTKGLCPNTERIYENILSIPLYPELTSDDVHSIIECVKKISRFYRK